MQLFLKAVPIILKLFSKAKGCLLFSNYSRNNSPKHTYHTVSSQQIMQEFPTILDGHIKTMEGVTFLLALTDGVKPLCVKVPQIIPFA